MAVNRARAEAERLHGELKGVPTLVTDNGSDFLSRRLRAHIDGALRAELTDELTRNRIEIGTVLTPLAGT